MIPKFKIAKNDFNYIYNTESYLNYKKKKSYYLLAKRTMDVFISLVALVVFSPIMLIVAIAIKIESPGPVIFKQTRVGMDGKEFQFYKFRSMVKDAEQKKKELKDLNKKGDIIFKIKDDPRITKVGKFIRKTSLDELPQLVNVLKSDMSIVGPRPPLPNEVEKYDFYQRERLSVKGGITCYWQISGRSKLSFDDWVELDIKYIKEMNLLLDIKIIIKTFAVVLKCDGAC